MRWARGPPSVAAGAADSSCRSDTEHGVGADLKTNRGTQAVNLGGPARRATLLGALGPEPRSWMEKPKELAGAVGRVAGVGSHCPLIIGKHNPLVTASG